MNRRERILAAVGALFFPCAAAVGLLADGTSLWSTDEVLSTSNCTIVSTMHDNASGPDAITVLLHGLSANRKLMEPLAHTLAQNHIRAYSIDLPGHGDSDEPFTFEHAEQCAQEFIETIAARDPAELGRPVIIGHSTGGGIAIRIAERTGARAVVAISPAPLTPQSDPWDGATPYRLPEKIPSNLLVVIAQFDPFPIRDSAKEWIPGAGGGSDATGARDVVESLRLIDVPWANHTSVLVDERVARESLTWIQRALNLPAHNSVAPLSYASHIALLGLVLLFPALASATAGVFASVPAASTPPAEQARLTGATYAVWFGAALVGVLLLHFWIPLRALGLMTGDYLASLLLIAGLIGMLWLRKHAAAAEATACSGRAAAAGCVMGLLTMLAGSALITWGTTDVWLNQPRWLRFPFILLAVLPYALAEEWALGPPRTVWRRLLQALALRGLLWTAMILSFLFLHSNQVLIPLLTLFLALFSVGQRLGADAIRRRTGSAAAAAAFDAILAAWYIAAVFPLT